MNITANTTDEQILAPIKRAKDTLILAATDAAATEHFTGENLVSLAQNVHTAETVATAQIHYRDLCVSNPAARLGYLFECAARVDDTWSGRRNDSTRSAHDGVVAWAREEVSNLRYEKA